MGLLDGKVALISGAAVGMGAAHVRRFVAEGARVIAADIDLAGVEQLAAEVGETTAVHLDVRSPESWKAAVEIGVKAFGEINVLVNNAGIMRYTPLATTSLDDYNAVIAINQAGTFLGMQAVIDTMTSAGGGSIVNISSMNGFVGGGGIVAYVASKFAVRGMTKAAAMELGSLGIRVNSIHPGAINTQMTAEAFGMMERKPTDLIPIARVGEPEEISELAIFLASDRSSYCTGAEFLADGGWTAGPTFG